MAQNPEAVHNGAGGGNGYFISVVVSVPLHLPCPGMSPGHLFSAGLAGTGDRTLF